MKTIGDGIRARFASRGMREVVVGTVVVMILAAFSGCGGGGGGGTSDPPPPPPPPREEPPPLPIEQLDKYAKEIRDGNDIAIVQGFQYVLDVIFTGWPLPLPPLEARNLMKRQIQFYRSLNKTGEFNPFTPLFNFSRKDGTLLLRKASLSTGKLKSYIQRSYGIQPQIYEIQGNSIARIDFDLVTVEAGRDKAHRVYSTDRTFPPEGVALYDVALGDIDELVDGSSRLVVTLVLKGFEETKCYQQFTDLLAIAESAQIGFIVGEDRVNERVSEYAARMKERMQSFVTCEDHLLEKWPSMVDFFATREELEDYMVYFNMRIQDLLKLRPELERCLEQIDEDLWAITDPDKFVKITTEVLEKHKEEIKDRMDIGLGVTIPIEGIDVPFEFNYSRYQEEEQEDDKTWRGWDEHKYKRIRNVRVYCADRQVLDFQASFQNFVSVLGDKMKFATEVVLPYCPTEVCRVWESEAVTATGTLSVRSNGNMTGGDGHYDMSFVYPIQGDFIPSVDYLLDARVRVAELVSHDRNLVFQDLASNKTIFELGIDPQLVDLKNGAIRLNLHVDGGRWHSDSGVTDWPGSPHWATSGALERVNRHLRCLSQ